MELGAIFLILAVVVLVGLFVARPFLAREATVELDAGLEETSSEHQRSTLMAERDRILNTLQELDFDFNLGKVPEEEYPMQRNALLMQGANILRALDTLEQQVSDHSVEERLEMAIAARRLDGAKPDSHPAPAMVGTVDVLADDPMERMISARRQTRPEPASGFCPRCGHPVQKSDQFCPKCGAHL